MPPVLPPGIGIVEEAVYRLLIGNVGVNEIVEGRVFPMVIEEGIPVPAIVYTRISAPRVSHLQGPSGLVTVRMQVDCLAARPRDAWVLADRVRRALTRTGPFTVAVDDAEPTPTTVRIASISLDSDRDEYASERRQPVRSLDIMVQHYEEG